MEDSMMAFLTGSLLFVFFIVLLISTLWQVKKDDK